MTPFGRFAYSIWEKRVAEKREGTPESDWYEAIAEMAKEGKEETC
jgi:hypothetical protein